MNEHSEVFVGLDVAKARHAVAVADEGRLGEVKYLGEIEADAASVRRMVTRLEKRHARQHFCYEAGPTGYGLYRQLIARVMSVQWSRPRSSHAGWATG